MFLLMTVLTPLSMAGQFWDSRKSGRRKFTESIDTYGVRLEKRKAEVEQAMLDERAERIHQSPDLADLARRATLRTLDLWARQRRDEEFLRTRLGIGTVASNISVEPETAGEEYLREATAATVTGYDRLPACPICVNLAELGVFGLHGALADVRGDVLVDHPPGGHVAQSRGPRARRRRGRTARARCVGEVAAAHALGDVADLGRPRRRGRRRRRRR